MRISFTQSGVYKMNMVSREMLPAECHRGRLWQSTAGVLGEQPASDQRRKTGPSKPNAICKRHSYMEWSTVSNAANRSSSVKTATSPSLTAWSMSDSTHKTAVSVEKWDRYAVVDVEGGYSTVYSQWFALQLDTRAILRPLTNSILVGQIERLGLAS
jgi:hypothetical protein